MGKGGKKTTQASAVDPATAAYIQQVRNMALGTNGAQASGFPMRREPQAPNVLGMDPATLASQFMNPYQSQVVDATRGEFDFLRDQAAMDANQQATMAGAFGGSRHGIMEGARLGELDRAQGSTIANLLQSGYNNALGFGQNAQQMRMNLLNMGMGPLGMTSSSTEKGSANPLMDLAGLGLSAYGVYQGAKGGGGGAPMGGGMPAPPGSGGLAYNPYQPRGLFG